MVTNGSALVMAAKYDRASPAVPERRSAPASGDVRVIVRRMWNPRLALVVAAIAPLAACASCRKARTDPFPDAPGPIATSAPVGVSSWQAPLASAPPADASAASAPQPPPPAAFAPSGFFLLSADRLAELRKNRASGKEGDVWRQNVDQAVKTFDQYRSSPENLALAYLVTGDTSYATAAFKWQEKLAQQTEIKADSYLFFGNLMRGAAFVLNYCAAAL